MNKSTFFIIYLLLNNALLEFLNLCFFGLLDYGKNNGDYKIFYLVGTSILLILNLLYIRKNKGVVCITCESGDMEIAFTDDDQRIFNPVPGFSFIPLQVLPDKMDKKIHINISFR